jgi:hypothetical protein
MTDPNDDLDSVADPGSMDEGARPQSDRNDHEDDDERRGTPGSAVDSPAVQGSPIGPPD